MAAGALFQGCGCPRPFHWNLTAAPPEPNYRVPGLSAFAERTLEESPDSLEQRCRVTPGRSNPTDSATENRHLRLRRNGETVG